MTVLHALRLFYPDQFAQVFYGEQSFKLRLYRLVLLIWVFLKAMRCGFNALFREQLGSQVEYRGKRYFVSNWSGSAYPNLAGDDYIEAAERDEIKNIINASELLHRYRFGFTFFLTNWAAIYINQKLFPSP